MNDLNFFSPYTEPQRSKTKVNMYPVIIVIFLIAVGAWTYYLLNVEVGKYEKQTAASKAYIESADTKQVMDEVNELKEKIEVLKKYHSEIEEINQEIKNAEHINSSLVSSIAAKKPQKAFINDITINEKGVSIKGIAESDTVVAQLQHNLRGLNIFKVVHVVSMKKKSEFTNNIEYELNCLY